MPWPVQVLLPRKGSHPQDRHFHEPHGDASLRAACGTFDHDGTKLRRLDAVERGYLPCPTCYDRDWVIVARRAPGSNGSTAYHTRRCRFVEKMRQPTWRPKPVIDPELSECSACAGEEGDQGGSPSPFAGRQALIETDPDDVGGAQS